MAFDPASLILPGVNLIGSLLGNLFGGSGGSTTAKTPPPSPKPEFQPLQRREMMSRQPMNFDPGASGSRMTEANPQLEALMRLRSKLDL